jgi:hypothetical protein
MTMKDSKPKFMEKQIPDLPLGPAFIFASSFSHCLGVSHGCQKDYFSW